MAKRENILEVLAELAADVDFMSHVPTTWQEIEQMDNRELASFYNKVMGLDGHSPDFMPVKIED